MDGVFGLLGRAVDFALFDFLCYLLIREAV